MEKIDAEIFNSMEIKQRISFMVKNVRLLYEKNLNKKMSEDNMTVSQALIMFYLNKNSGSEVNPVDLERQFGLSRPTITGILKRLEAKGFIRLSESSKDKRYKQVCLTEEGRGCLKKVDVTLKQMDNSLCSGFSDEELEKMYFCLHKMIENLNYGEENYEKETL